MAKGGDNGKRRQEFPQRDTGRFVTKGFADRNPKTTLGEARGGGSTKGAHRSAITGKFVGPAAAGRWPTKTIKDS
jgi:hypothetical protein